LILISTDSSGERVNISEDTAAAAVETILVILIVVIPIYVVSVRKPRTEFSRSFCSDFRNRSLFRIRSSWRAAGIFPQESELEEAKEVEPPKHRDYGRFGGIKDNPRGAVV
jgi:hypothetical protein